MSERTLSVKEAMVAVGVSRRTIFNWISAGKVRIKRTAGGSPRIYADSLWRDEDKIESAVDAQNAQNR